MSEAKLKEYGLTIDNIDVRVKIIENRSLKAIVALDFGPFSVKGFRISKSKYVPDSSEQTGYGDELWVVPPSYKDTGGKYHPTFFMPKDLWNELKKHILSEYEKAADTYYRKRMEEPNF